MTDLIRSHAQGLADGMVAELAQMDLFHRLERAEVAEIARFAEMRRYGPGEAIIDFDDTEHEVFFLFSGSASINNYTLLSTPVTLSTIGPGSYFGELSAIDGGPRSARVVAETDCLVAAVPPEEFIRVLSRHPSVLGQTLRNLAGMIRASNRTVLDHATI